MPLVESQGQWLNDMPTIESLNTSNQNQLNNLAQAPNEQKDYSSAMGDFYSSSPYQQQDTSSSNDAAAQAEAAKAQADAIAAQIQSGASSSEQGNQGSGTPDSSDSSSSDFFVNRGGRIQQHVPEFYHGGFAHHARRARALGGPMAPQFGVQPISMNYGMDTQDTLKQHAQNAVGAGVSPISEGQEALASGYYMGNQ